jgi:predicted NAD/FAD-binding protein
MSTSTGKQKQKVLVVGCGVAGIAVAWHLNNDPSIDVTVFEADSKIGGHANTITVDGVKVDTGFMVYNAVNYPNLCAFFDEIGVEGQETEMGFSVSMNGGKFEWCSESLAGLFATPSNAINPQFYTMMYDIMRFNKEANAALKSIQENEEESPEASTVDATGAIASVKNMTTGQFLAHHKFSTAFRDLYLVPMTGAIWSATTNDILAFPIVTLLTFLNNHLLLQVAENLSWRTPKHRSEQVTRVSP